MDSRPAIIACGVCGQEAARVVGNFHFQEDRYRFFRNPIDGTTHSYALGMEHPDNRADYQRACAERGCEPVTPRTMPQAWKDDQAYREHVEHGGERSAPELPKPSGIGVLDQLRASKTFRVGS